MQTNTLALPGLLTNVVDVQVYTDSQTLMHLRMRDGSRIAVTCEEFMGAEFCVTLFEPDGTWGGSRWVLEEAVPAAMKVLLAERVLTRRLFATL